MTEDKIKILGVRLKKVMEAFDVIKHFGIDEDILIAYIKYKTNLSKTDIKSMIRATDEFYNKLLKTEIVKSLQDEK